MIEVKLVRSFSIGFAIYSPTQNGLAVSVDIACFNVLLRNRGGWKVTFTNYWR
jgi:hypothetical protein